MTASAIARCAEGVTTGLVIFGRCDGPPLRFRGRRLTRIEGRRGSSALFIELWETLNRRVVTRTVLLRADIAQCYAESFPTVADARASLERGPPWAAAPQDAAQPMRPRSVEASVRRLATRAAAEQESILHAELVGDLLAKNIPSDFPGSFTTP